MLPDSALDTFVALLRKAEETGTLQTAEPPESALRGEAGSANLLYRAEFTQLWRSLKITCAAGDTSAIAVQVFDKIIRQLTEEERCYVPLTCSDAWIKAIQWALPRIEFSDSIVSDRQLQVGRACQRLRRRGYHVSISARGPHLDDETQAEIAQRISFLILQAGGAKVAHQICASVRQTNNLHDGLWLLGNRVASIGNTFPPAVPIGWLFSLAIRHIHRQPSSRKFQATLRTAVSLATDAAACLDCQRYNQFDEMDLHATDFLRVLGESLTWREVFSLPQVPPWTLNTLRQALSNIRWPNGAEELRHEVDRSFAEVENLLSASSYDCLTKIPQQRAREQYPTLWRQGRAEPGEANADYLGPLEASKRNHEKFVFLGTADGDAYILPRAMTAAAACEVIFGRILSAIPEKAPQIIGATIETSVFLACQGKADRFYQNEGYRAADGKHLEIDVATRTGHQIVLFETKSKSLTRTSRSGDMVEFLSDYTKSYLSLLKQLVRHDRHLKNGSTPLTEDGENLDTISVMKVAVSPLSYGPASDKVLANTLMRSIAHARLISTDTEPKRDRILDEFNKALDEITSELTEAGTAENDGIDLFRYMLGVMWLDLGEVLYVLDRGLTVEKGLSALKHLTFGTRDFWTEAAFADRQKITAGNWRSLEAFKPTCGRCAS